MLGHGATGQFAIGEFGTGVAAGAEFIGPDKYMRALSEPVRFMPGLKVSQQQFSALSDPFPFVSFSWFEELSKPAVLTKSGLRASQQQFLALYPTPSPFVATGWFAPLSEPVRKRPGLTPSRQPFFTTDTSVIPTSRMIEWFSALSEPVRFRQGLSAQRQQFLAAPSRLLPTSTVFGILDALETKDIFLLGASRFNPPASAEIGIVDTGFPLAEIGVAMPTVASVSISIQII